MSWKSRIENALTFIAMSFQGELRDLDCPGQMPEDTQGWNPEQLFHLANRTPTKTGPRTNLTGQSPRID